MRWISLCALLLAAVVVVLGAYTRLTEAGLGCPDWPGCYGFHLVPSQSHELMLAERRFPDTPLQPHLAWNEMIHRYCAGLLGLVILAQALLSLYRRQGRRLAWLTLALVVGQGLLGMLTVTMNLFPLVVLSHLLGGMTILALLWLAALRHWSATHAAPSVQAPGRTLRLLRVGLVALVIQIALGGWTSANYAALTCHQLPWCEGPWWHWLDFIRAFDPVPPPSDSYQFGVLPYGARMTIQLTHRSWALVTVLTLLWLAWQLGREGWAVLGGVLATLVLLQVVLGVSNIGLMLPLLVALAHHGVAALLLLTMVTVWFVLGRRPAHTGER